MDRALVEAVRHRLAVAADPAKAQPMQAYMKSAMPFRGVQSAGVRGICRELFAAHPLGERAVWEETVRELFDNAAYREERYAAIALTGHSAYAQWQDAATLRMYDHLLVNGAWWDFVDEIAIRRIGSILRADPERARPVLLRWALDEDLWRRRAAILAQNRSKAATDTALLEDCLEPSLSSKEFFLRKGIGWALREYAKTDPAWVRTYVSKQERRLSALTKREATKHLGAMVTSQ